MQDKSQHLNYEALIAFEIDNHPWTVERVDLTVLYLTLEWPVVTHKHVALYRTIHGARPCFLVKMFHYQSMYMSMFLGISCSIFIIANVLVSHNARRAYVM